MTKQAIYKKYMSQIIWESIRQTYNIPNNIPTDAQRLLIDNIVSATYKPLASKFKKPELEQILSGAADEV